MTRLYRDILAALERCERVAVATVVRAEGSTPRAVGAKMIVFPDGGFRYSVGGGVFESVVIKDALGVIETRKNVIRKYSFNEEGQFAVGAVCGGTAEVWIEMIENAPSLFIVGGGHVGQALARAARLLDFNVTIIDDREDYARPTEEDRQIKTIHTPPDYSGIPEPSANTFVCLVSKGYASDEAALRRVIASPARYIGMIGSRKKIATVFGNLSRDGFDKQLFTRVHAPIGLDIHSDTPEEIAISILAEIIGVKNQK